MKKKSFGFAGKISKNAEKRKKGGGFGHLLTQGLDVFSPEMDSKIEMDILPYLVSIKNHPDRDDDSGIAVEGSYWYKRPFKFHRNVGAGNTSEICLQSIGKKCPICEYREKLKKDEAAEDDIKALRPSERNLYAIVITKIDGKKQERKIQLFEFSDYLFQERFEEQLSDKDGFETFPDPFNGCTISIKFAENNLGGNKYPDPTRFDFVTRKEQYDQEFVDEVPDLEECLRILSYKELKDKFFEEPEDDEDEETEEEAPKKRNKKSEPVKAKRKAKPVEEDEEDEDEEEPEEDDEDEEEPEEKPSKKKQEVKRKKELDCEYGHTFGKDNGKFDDCDDCELWNECHEKRAELKRK